MPTETPQQVIEHVARRIAELREKAGLTQAQMAERLETTVPNYQRMEHGLQNLTLKTLARVAVALEATTADLFKPARKRKRKKGRPRKILLVGSKPLSGASSGARVRTRES